MRNEGKKNERRSTPPSFGILLLPRQIGSEHVLHHKLPSKQTKRKKDGFQFKFWIYWSSSPSRSRRRRSTRKTFSLSFSLSLLGKNTLSKKAASDSFCAVYITAFSSKAVRITLYNHRQHHLLPSKGREREIRDLSLARAPRESSSSAPGRDTKQKNLSLLVLFLFVSKTDSYYYSLKSKPPHGSYQPQ